jgi:hypothetical protein
MTVPFRWSLSLANTGLAAFLLWLGAVQRAALLAHLQEIGGAGWSPLPWCYTPPAFQICGAIIPATLLAGILNLFVPNSRLYVCALLVNIFVLWWLLGMKFDGKLTVSSRIWRITLSVLGIAIGVAALISVLSSYWGHSVYWHLGLLLWGLSGTIYSTRALRCQFVTVKVDRARDS